MTRLDRPQTLFSLPYGDIVRGLLTSLFEAYKELASGSEHISDIVINEKFSWLNNRDRAKDAHLFISRVAERSLRARDETIAQHPTRISRLVLNTFSRVEVQSRRIKGALLPSPLHILLDYLTVPTEAASKAYAFATIRNLVFEELQLWPQGPSAPAGFETFTFQQVDDELARINTYLARRARADNVPPEGGDPPLRQLLCHLLAMKGLLNLRFGEIHGGKKARLEYCVRGKLISDNYEFRISEDIEDLPSAAEIINELWGVPVPIRGADTIFFGGLRFSVEGGLVAAVNGPSGTGKTSFVLGLAAALAPLGTKTFYVTAEESPDDLQARLATLTPRYLHRLSFDKSSYQSYFKARRLPPRGDPSLPPRGLLRELIAEIRATKSTAAQSTQSDPPLPCPLIVVIDGVQSYFAQEDTHPDDGPLVSYSIEQFITDCRSLGALVVLISASDFEEMSGLDYSVDVVIRLQYRHTDNPSEKPVRVLILSKTRHQIARPGAHIFHISGADGIRISPQLPSQLDKRAHVRIAGPDRTYRIDSLNRPIAVSHAASTDERHLGKRFFRGGVRKNFLELFPRSHILIHGQGSSGKAGFGLKLLAAPWLPRKGDNQVTRKNDDVIKGGEHHRILVVSFLYPLDYYKELLDRINTALTFEYRASQFQLKVPPSNLDVLHFYPGYLNPEDLVYKVIRKLEQAEWEGEPYDGVLLDGVHNVFLQFPRLEQNPMLWPMLYDLLRRRDITVVTTHTTVSLEYEDSPMDNYVIRLREAKPLLHAIIQSSDFFLELGVSRDEEDVEPGNEVVVPRYKIRVKSAIGQSVPAQCVLWHRELLIVFEQAQGELFSGARA